MAGQRRGDMADDLGYDRDVARGKTTSTVLVKPKFRVTTFLGRG
jgi:hypothetical protein